MSAETGIRAQPALIVGEQNRYDYLCVVMVEPSTNTFIVDTDLCSIKKGTRQEVATRVSQYLRGMGYAVKIVK